MNGMGRTAQELVRAFRGRPSLTRLKIQELTGLSRVTISQGIQALLSEKVLIESERGPSDGGRKATSLSLNPEGGYVAIVYFSATTMNVALSNLQGELLDVRRERVSIENGPRDILPASIVLLKEVLKGVAKSKRLGIIIGVPGPVSHETGRVVSPPIMRGWDGINFYEEFSQAFSLDTYLENDANLMAFAEHRLVYPEVNDLLLVKLGTGIGSGLIINKVLHRGAEGAAGDIGHIQLDVLKGSICRCGHTDCLESFAGGWALAEKINAIGFRVRDVADIAELARNGNPKILHLIAEASSYVGHAIADAVNLINPKKIVIEGRLVGATDLVLAMIKEVVYERAGALATKNLEIVPSKLGNDRALLGAAHLGLDRFFYKVL